jgi:RNA polymerase sigma factor (sigma-70 family)
MQGMGGNSEINRPASISSNLHELTPGNRKWPERLKEISGALQRTQDESTRRETSGQAWKILYFALSQYLRSHASRLGGISREDIEDLAEEKSLDLINRIVSKKTDFSDRSPPEIASFLSKVARNDLLDFLSRSRRRVVPDDENAAEWDVAGISEGIMMNKTDQPDVKVEREEFTRALRQCIENLDWRSRLIWFFRVFYGMSSKDIAVHPEIDVKPGHVDVILQRSREAIRRCMQRKNYQPNDMPPGTFTELWKELRLNSVIKRAEL